MFHVGWLKKLKVDCVHEFVRISAELLPNFVKRTLHGRWIDDEEGQNHANRTEHLPRHHLDDEVINCFQASPVYNPRDENWVSKTIA